MSETKLAMAERRVREGAERIDRQEELIAKLDQDYRAHMLPKAYRLLAEIRSIQAMFEEHVCSIMPKSGALEVGNNQVHANRAPDTVLRFGRMPRDLA